MNSFEKKTVILFEKAIKESYGQEKGTKIFETVYAKIRNKLEA